ncbi:hypothetical protein [Thauera aromatica]|nr:hypothetical protein [Thauera aromatica]
MRTALVAAALLAAFALVGTLGYQAAADLAGEYALRPLAAAPGDHHGTR